MTQSPTTPTGSSFAARVEAFVAHVARNRVLPPHLRFVASAAPSVVLDALERLHIEHEELAVASEELRVQLETQVTNEHALAAERVQYREVFDFAPDPLFVTDRQGVVQQANLAALEMLSIEAVYLAGKPLLVLVHGDDRPAFLATLGEIAAQRRAGLTLVLEGRRGAHARVELRGALLPDGARILWSAREVVPIGDLSGDGGVQGDALGRALFAQAETLRRVQREKAEILVRERQTREAHEAAVARLGERERAIAVLGHELRGPVNIVLGWTRLLRANASDDAQRAKALETIERHAIAQAALIDELLDAAALAAGRTKLDFEVTDVGAFVREVAEAVRPTIKAKSLNLACEAPAGLLVLGDTARLIQVVTNLLTNAIKFTPEGGNIAVRCRPCDRTALGPAVEVVVEDDGRGVRTSELEEVFGFFRQGKGGNGHARSLGLGLYLVRQFVELHGGTVGAESEGPERGTRFTVTLPALLNGHDPRTTAG
jgi:PAS domain S-box-containing protein